MINDFKKIEELFTELNNSMKGKAEVYIIGGAALLKRGMKSATKDVDLVVKTKQAFIELQRALDTMNFSPKIPGKDYTHMKLSQIFQRGEFRIDLFEKEVCEKFLLSKDMTKRAEKIMKLNSLKVFLCSNEDIFLFKTMTQREGDIHDCISIATTQDLDWNIILKELKNQVKHRGVWITWVGERMDLLEDKGLNIPIKKELDRMIIRFLKELERRYKIK